MPSMNTVLEFHVLCWMKSKSKIRKRDELLSVEQESNVRTGNCWLATHGLGFPELLAFSDHHQLYIFFSFSAFSSSIVTLEENL